jgi:hypothetical protein
MNRNLKISKLQQSKNTLLQQVRNLSFGKIVIDKQVSTINDLKSAKQVDKYLPVLKNIIAMDTQKKEANRIIEKKIKSNKVEMRTTKKLLKTEN